jgi:hypothetical protein
VERLEERAGDGTVNGACSFIAFSQLQGDTVRAAIASSVVQHGWNLLEIKPIALSLEDLFMRLVTREDEQ